MPDYRRDYSGTTWFFTVVTHERREALANDQARDALRIALTTCRTRFPFRIDAWVLLPDHLHAVWTLPESDPDYSRRWSIIKRGFTQHMQRAGAGHAPFWQPRFWAHRIDDERDFANHVDYVHINPVKHGFVDRVANWPWSSFHRYVRNQVIPSDWGGDLSLPGHVGNE